MTPIILALIYGLNPLAHHPDPVYPTVWRLGKQNMLCFKEQCIRSAPEPNPFKELEDRVEELENKLK